MLVKDSVRKLSEAKIRIADRVSAGAQFHSAYLDIAERAQGEIPARLPFWAKQYLAGYLDAKLERLWREVEFRYQIPRRCAPAGVAWHPAPIPADWPANEYVWVNASDLVYANGTCRTEAICEHSGHYVALHNPPAAHFWTGTDRPFTTPQPVTEPAKWAAQHPREWQATDRAPAIELADAG